MPAVEMSAVEMSAVLLRNLLGVGTAIEKARDL